MSGVALLGLLLSLTNYNSLTDFDTHCITLLSVLLHREQLGLLSVQVETKRVP
jgi:hypothetical protein